MCAPGRTSTYPQSCEPGPKPCRPNNNKMTDEHSEIEIKNLDDLDEYLVTNCNSRNTTYISKIPDICKSEPCILGIDEAGRGPVLGPMVYGTAFCPVTQQELLNKLRCEDSKALTEEKRDAIFSNICNENNKMGWAVEVIAPNSICNSMFSKSKISLNKVSMDSAIGLIRRAISEGVNIALIYVDTVGPPEKYQEKLLQIFPNYLITVSKKADSIYPIVSAASICAKVTRDHALKKWIFQEGLNLTQADFGSGYPGDPVTKKFMNDHRDLVFGYPQLVRFSWSTASNILSDTAYQVDWEEPESTETTSPTNTLITSFFKSTAQPKINERHAFFKERNLKRFDEL